MPIYADTIPLPAPVTSGSTLQSYKDPLGDIWVAKNGVRSGNWRRARNVLRARVHRATSYTMGAAGWNSIPLDAVTWDEYGMMTLNQTTTTFTCPLAGFWHANAGINLSGIFTRLLCMIAVNGGDTNRGLDVNANIMGTLASDILNLAVGNNVALFAYTGSASTVAWNGVWATYLTLEYHAPPIGT